MRALPSLFFILFFLILIPTQVFAEELECSDNGAVVNTETCQCKETVIDTEELKTCIFDNNDNILSDVKIILPNDYGRPLKIMNPHPVDISIILDININIESVQWCTSYSTDMDQIRQFEIIIPKESSYELPVIETTTNFYCNNFKFTEPYEIKYQNTDDVIVKTTKVTTYKEVCVLKDNGDSCEKSTECCSNICSIAETCEDTFIVPCPDDQINCKNQLCSEPSITGAGDAYSCEFQCKSGRGKNGVCKRTIETLIIQITVVGSIIVVFFWLIIFRKGIEIQNILKDYETMRKKLEGKQKELDKLEKVENKTIEQLEKIKSLNEKIKNEEIELKTPRKSRILAAYEWGNPKFHYYPCYVNDGKETDILIHREQAEKKIFNVKENKKFFDTHYPNKRFNDLQVHHIDDDSSNYRINNLVILSKDEHNKIDHGKIYNRTSGVEELLEKVPHIKELNP